MKRNLITFSVAVIFLFIIFLTGNIITIGDKLGEASPLLEWAFYAFISGMVVYYLLWPVIKLWKAPAFPALNVDGACSPTQLKDFAGRLINNCGYITDDVLRTRHQATQRAVLKEIGTETDRLKEFISEEINLRIEGSKELNVSGINSRIKEWAKTVFVVTAVSQNGKMDSLAVIGINLRLISDIVKASGFRPTKPQMIKLYIKVLTTSLITYITSSVLTDAMDFDPTDVVDDVSDAASDSVDVDGLDIGSSLVAKLRKLPLAGVLLESAIEGTINALMTLRIGYVTKAYLMQGPDALSGIKAKRKVKRQAIKESFKAFPSVIADTGAMVGNNVVKVLTFFFRK